MLLVRLLLPLLCSSDPRDCPVCEQACDVWQWPLSCAANSGDPRDCDKCDQVPCGSCQQGCNVSNNGCPQGVSRNGCKNGNKGDHPRGCTIPPSGPPNPPLPPGKSFCDEAGWQRVFADEFEGADLDNMTWTNDMGWDTLSSLRTAKNMPDNVWVENGALVIRSQRQHAGPYIEGIPKILYPNTTSFKFTSAAVTTNGKRAFGGKGRTTRVCVRAQLPGGGGKGKGYWPAHWLLPSGCPAGCSKNKSTGCSAAELDFLEMVDGDGSAHQTYHSQPNCKVIQYRLERQSYIYGAYDFFFFFFGGWLLQAP